MKIKHLPTVHFGLKSAAENPRLQQPSPTRVLQKTCIPGLYLARRPAATGNHQAGAIRPNALAASEVGQRLDQLASRRSSRSLPAEQIELPTLASPSLFQAVAGDAVVGEFLHEAAPAPEQRPTPGAISSGAPQLEASGSEPLAAVPMQPAVKKVLPQYTRDEAGRARPVVGRSVTAAEVDQAYSEMAQKGRLWRIQGNAKKTIKELSSRNMEALRSELGELNPMEMKFHDALVGAKYFATHATKAQLTNEQGAASIYSRKQAMSKEIEFPHGNTERDDLTRLAADDFVYFSMECEGGPKKPGSRFGNNLLRFDFSHPEFEGAWMSLGDLNHAPIPDTKTWLPFLSEEDHKTLKKRKFDGNSVFHGDDLLPGMALSAIKLCRGLSAQGQADMLGEEAKMSLNDVLNGLFRPQVMVAKQFVATPLETTGIEFLEEKLTD